MEDSNLGNTSQNAQTFVLGFIWAVARRFKIPSVMQRKMKSDVDLQDVACMRKDLKETAVGTQGQKQKVKESAESQGKCRGQCYSWHREGVQVHQ